MTVTRCRGRPIRFVTDDDTRCRGRRSTTTPQVRRQREGVEKELGSDELTLAGPGGADAAAPEDTDAVRALVARYDERSRAVF